MMPLDLVAEVTCLRLRRAGELEGVAHHAVHPHPGEDGFLDRHLALGPLEQPSADLGVLALGVLADDDEVDVRGRATGQGRAHSRQEPHRPHVHVLVEAAADGDQQAPERDVIRDVRGAHGPEQDRVEGPQPLEPVRRHHDAVLGIVAAGIRELLEFHLEGKLCGQRLQHSDAFRDDLQADAVPRDQGHAMGHVRRSFENEK